MEYGDYDDLPYGGDIPYQEQQHTAYYGGRGVHNNPMMHQVHTTKIPPAYAGDTSWFAFEEAVEDWLDVTELDAEKRGPALRNRLEGAAAIYKPLLDRDELKRATTQEPNAGVRYFLKEMRPKFIKGSQSVFLWRFFAFFKAHRGHQDFHTWLSRLTVTRKRMLDAWGDLYIDVDQTDPAFQMWFNARVQASQGQQNQLDPRDPTHVAEGILNYNHREKTQTHMALFPLGDNMFSLIVTVFADLNEQQRERFQSTMVLKGFRVNQYSFDLVREVMIELFVTAKTTLDNPNIKAGNSSRSFCIIEEVTDAEGTDGYWVEDDETHEEGFLPETQDIFWVYDEVNDVWNSRHFRGRSLRRGNRKGKGKGKGGKGRRKGRFKSRRKGKGKGSYQVEAYYTDPRTWKEREWEPAEQNDGQGWDQYSDPSYGYQTASITEDKGWKSNDWTGADWDDTQWGDGAAQAFYGKGGKGKGKGKGKKGEKGDYKGGKSKGKGKGKKGEGKDGKGDHAANVVAETSQDNEGWQVNEWSEDHGHAWLCYEEWPAAEIALLDLPNNDHQSHLTPSQGETNNKSHKVTNEACIAAVPGNDVLKRTHHAFWETSKTWSPGVPGNPKLIDMSKHPTHVILDLGCARAMGSRPAIMAFVQAATKRGLKCEILPTQGKFNFANSQTTTCTEKMRIWFPTTPPVSTDFDIVEEGNVPLLMSLIQMRNLRFNFELTPESCQLTSPALGARFEVEQSTARHLVLDLCWIQGIDPGSSRIIQSPDVNLEFPSFASSDALVNTAKGPPKDPNCKACQGSKKNAHTCERRRQPAEPDADIDKRDEDPEGKLSIKREVPSKRLTKKGQIPPGEARVPPQGERARGSGEPEGLEQAEPADPPPAPEPQPEEPDAGGVPPALAKLHKRLSKEVELYKLHLKHYHMSVTQFRRRTNQLALPESVYEKYEHICKTCKVCSQYARPPARSRISGIRAENFGDIIFVDYAEIKVEGARGGNVVVLLVLDGATSLLWAKAQRSYEAGETLDNLREWCDTHSSRPKTICGDSAFFQPHFQKWYRGEGIKELPTGPKTPWPNRAESAVRLFKKQFTLLV